MGTILNVVNDAGHFGYAADSGAVGAKGTYERNVTFSVATKVNNKLRRHKDITSWMTRQIGVNYNIHSMYQDLDQRCAYAQDHYDNHLPRAKNILVSYHVNCSDSSGAAYISSYIHGTGGPAERLAGLLQSEMCAAVDFERFGLEDAGIKVANFQMLRVPDAVCVLVEMGFISNPGEEALLATEEYQERFAEAIYRGICCYAGITPLNAEGVKVVEKWAIEAMSDGVKAGIIAGGVHQPDEPATKAFVVKVCLNTAALVTETIKAMLTVKK